jgi:hypothetical protein
MPNFTDITGLGGVASVMIAAMLLLPGIARPSTKPVLGKPRRAILLGAVFVLMLIPFGALPVASYVRGVTGDLSITTQVLMWCTLLKQGCDCVTVDGKQRQALLMMIALFALALYPMALGIGAYDPYRLGYGDPLFIAALLLLVLFAWSLKSALIVLCIALATLAWATGWYESSNIWDYLIDPFVSFYALAAITIRGVRKLLKLQQNPSC